MIRKKNVKNVTFFKIKKKKMSREAKQLIKIPNDLLKKCAEKYWSKLEVSISAINVIENNNSDESSKILILSSAAIYKFNISNNEPKIELQQSLLSMNKIKFEEPEDLSFEFGDVSLSIKSSDAFIFANAVVKQHSVIYYKIPNNDLVVESVPMNLLKTDPLTKRPSGLLQARFAAFQNHYKKQFTIQNIKFIKEWDRAPNGSITLEGDLNRSQSTIPFTMALGWDPNLHTLNMKNFMPDIAHSFIPEIVNSSVFLRNLNISDYRSPCSGEYSFIGGTTCKLDSLSLNGNHSSVVMSIFKGLFSFAGHIENLSISNCQLSPKEVATIITSIGKYDCFMELKNLTIDGLSFEDITTDIFTTFLKHLPKLQDVKLYRIENDISQHASLLLHHPPMLHIDIQKSRIDSQISPENASPKLDFINLKDCITTPQTFKQIASTVLSQKRDKPVVLCLQSFERSLNSGDFFKLLLEINPQPNLIEFDWRQNPIDYNEATLLIQFLKTQENLEYLNLRGCIRKGLTTTLPLLSEYICNSKLKGFDLSSDHLRGSPQYYSDFLLSLIPAKRLHSISIVNMKLGDQGANVVLKLAQNLPLLEELSFDNVDISSLSTFISVYSHLMEISHLRSIQPPKKDFERLDVINDPSQIGKRIVASLKKMPPPKTCNERLISYEQNGFTPEDAPVSTPVIDEDKTDHSVGNQLGELKKIMDAMIGTIEDGYGPNPFNISMALLKTLTVKDSLTRDSITDDGTNLISRINEELDADDKL